MSFLETLEASLGGPMHFRFIVQPLVGMLLGLRDARRDVEAGKPPYFWSLLTQSGRRGRLKEGFKEVTTPFVVAVLMDALVQHYMVGRISLVMALLVGTGLIALPYLVARGGGNRLIRLLQRHRQARHA